jgi:hypothetical protein
MQNYEYGFYVLAIFTILTVVIVVLKRKAIQIAVGIIKEASDAIKAMPFLVLFPLLPFSLILLLGLYWMVGAAFIYTAEDVSLDDATQQRLRQVFDRFGYSAEEASDMIVDGAQRGRTGMR